MSPDVADVAADLQSAASVKLGFAILSIRITNPAITEFRIANPEQQRVPDLQSGTTKVQIRNNKGANPEQQREIDINDYLLIIVMSCFVPANDVINKHPDNQSVTNNTQKPNQRHCEEVFPTRQSRDF